MCTAVIEVPESPEQSVRLLAVRDEDPARAWDAPGRWWPDRPGVVGVRDRVAGGAWLAAAPADRRLALVLNRAEAAGAGLPEGPSPAGSRGALVLDEVCGRPVADPPGTANFNLLAVEGSSVSVTSWNGSSLSRVDLEPGVHMIAHHDVDDAAQTPRIARWLPEFRALAGLPDEAWRRRWVAVLEESTRLAVDDDRAIIRDNRRHGYATLSLLVCLAELRAESEDPRDGLRIDAAVLAEPGRWSRSTFDSLSA